MPTLVHEFSIYHLGMIASAISGKSHLLEAERDALRRDM